MITGSCTFLKLLNKLSHRSHFLHYGFHGHVWNWHLKTVMRKCREDHATARKSSYFLLLGRRAGLFLSSGRRRREAYESNEQEGTQVSVHVAHRHTKTLAHLPRLRAPSFVFAFWFSSILETQLKISLPDSFYIMWVNFISRSSAVCVYTWGWVCVLKRGWGLVTLVGIDSPIDTWWRGMDKCVS